MPDDDLSYLSGLSQHPDRPGDVSNMNPDFSSRLAAALRQARAAGLPVGVMSGYRNDTTTGSPYDAGGNSSHGYGLASDISGLDGPNGKITNQWAQIASANGLHNPYGVGNKAEFNHWQLPPQPLEQTPNLLASLKSARATGDWQNVWSSYNSGASTAMAQPSHPTTQTPGTTLNSPMDLVAQVESGNQNIKQKIHDINTDRGTPAGGFFQIIDPTWQRYAGTAGVDVKQYPTAMSAPREVQAQVAGAIPVNQWGPDTVSALKAQYPKIDTSQTLGQVQSAAVGASATPATPAAPTGALSSNNILPGFGTQGASDKFKTSLTDLDKAASGQGPEGGQAQQPQASPMGPPPIARNTSPMGGALLPQSAQLAQMVTGYTPQAYGHTLNSIGDPTQAAAPPQGAQASPMGTSLAGMQMAYGLSPAQLQMLMNPMMLAQEGG